MYYSSLSVYEYAPIANARAHARAGRRSVGGIERRLHQPIAQEKCSAHRHAHGNVVVGKRACAYGRALARLPSVAGGHAHEVELLRIDAKLALSRTPSGPY